MEAGLAGGGLRDRPAAAVRGRAGRAGARARRGRERVRRPVPASTRRSSRSECGEGDYRRRLEAAYPIHPELFDRLFEDWSTLEKFQRTRGVLRLMAAVIHELWERDDNGLLIMPASVPIDARAGAGRADPLPGGRVDAGDRGRRRRARTRCRCSSTARTRTSGASARRGGWRARSTWARRRRSTRRTRASTTGAIKLGCVQPGESPATFGDALRRLANRATYLVEDNGQYWYALGQTISRTAADRAQSRFLEEHADEEIRRRLLAIEGARRLRRRALGAARAGRGARRDGGAARRARPRACRTASGTEVTPAREMAASDPRRSAPAGRG